MCKRSHPEEKVTVPGAARYNQGIGYIIYKNLSQVNFIETYMKNILSEGGGFRSHLFIFVFISITLGDRSKKILLQLIF